MTSKGWVGMGSLGIGTEILTRAGPRLVVKSVVRKYYAGGVKVYNFTVDGKHTYFVGDALGGAWVHNAPCPDDIIPATGEYKYENIGVGNAYRAGSKNQVFNLSASVEMDGESLNFVSNFKVNGKYLDGFRHEVEIGKDIQYFEGKFSRILLEFTDDNALAISKLINKKGYTPEEAALLTPSGKNFAKYGYNQVECRGVNKCGKHSFYLRKGN
jgi:hypothetical protein